MTEDLTPDRRRLLYRAQHRGFKEADLVVGGFAAENLPTMSNEDVTEFARLLEVPDQELYGWIIGREETPPNYEGPVMTRLQKFDVAAMVAPRKSD